MIITSFNPLGVGEMAKDYVVEYSNNYRKWKSGFIEQWGTFIGKGGATDNSIYTQVNLPIPYPNADYSVQLTMAIAVPGASAEYWAQGSYRCSHKNSNYFTLERYNFGNFSGTSGSCLFDYYACGY